MRIRNHRIEGAPFEAARWTGGRITPDLVILHDTAGRLEKGSSVEWLQDNPNKVSAHVVIERDGSLTQLVPFNRRANHAGTSHYHGRDACNGFSVGIEIVNPGRMTAADSGSVLTSDNARAWWGEIFDVDDAEIAAMETPEHGRGLWMHYTEAQIAAVIALLTALFTSYDSLKDIRPHWYVSPGRKVDTNPLFPLAQVRSLILGREDRVEAEVVEQADAARWSADGVERVVRVVTGGEGLNMRSWPSFNPNVIAAIPDGTRVPVNREGTFGGRRWLNVTYGGREGWIVERYTAL
jgi:N-acetylmuramoyl-L-alanine amidase